MIFEPIVFTMKDGRTAILRPPEASDAANMLACLREESGETDFILTYPEDWDSMTVAQEESFLTACRNSPDCMMLICEVDGEIAGNCDQLLHTPHEAAPPGRAGHCPAQSLLGTRDRHPHV